MSEEYSCVDLRKLFGYLKSPSIEMKEAGSLASDYDLSQTRAGEVFKQMINTMFYRLENPNE